MQRLELTDALAAGEEQADDRLVAVDAALEELARHDPDKAELVKLRYYAGLTVEQAAQTLGMSRATADRHWAYARAWLFDRIQRENPGQ
jgi:RNA polymerase sigma factor (sigma-70 family)